jgi:translation elongation factor EF-Tu-like GTPase
MWWYIGVLLKNIKEKEVSRGDMLASLGMINPFNVFKCKVYFLLHKEGGRNTGFGCIINHNFFLELVM